MPGNSNSKSGVQFFPGQDTAIGSNVFGDGGIFSQFLAGKPNAGFDRAQLGGLEQIGRRDAQLGVADQPIATRHQMDYLTKTNQASGDNFMSTLFNFMQPAGSTSKSTSGSILTPWVGKG